jgi:secreted trypsin-like serine protease
VVQGGSAATDLVSAVTKYVVNEEGHGCSGTLVSPDVVITAAHCLPKDSTKRIIVITVPKGFEGKDKDLVARGKISHVMSFKAHPGFAVQADSRGSVKASDDLALLRLREPLAGSPLAGLPDPAFRISSASSMSLSSITETAEVIIAGWGLKDSHEASLPAAQRSRKLMQAEGRIRLIESGPSNGKAFTLAGFSNICSGDSGGPSFIRINGGLAIVGVHSSASGCRDTKAGWAVDSSTDIYLPPYVEWIRQTARALGSRSQL